METAAQNKAWIAKIVGSGYFILLGLIYTVMEMVSGDFALMDLSVLLWVCLPVLLNKRWLHLIFGSLNLIIWSYAGMAILVNGVSEVWSLVIISGVTLLSIVAALMLIYSALSISEKRFSLI